MHKKQNERKEKNFHQQIQYNKQITLKKRMKNVLKKK